jgi:GntR family transcriptional regulator, carbon starvation induced regulator
MRISAPNRLDLVRHAGSSVAKKIAMQADKSLADGTHRRLRKDIIDGRLQPGTKLKLENLAAAYNVGMSPLREALSRLIGESLVVSESQRGFWVAPLSIEELDDLTRVRLLIECEALSLSFQFGDATWQASLTAAFAALTQVETRAARAGVGFDAERQDEWERCNGDFHFVLVEACRSPILITTRKWLYYQSERYRRISRAVSSESRDLHDEHTAIYEAAMQRNVLKACRLIEYHLLETAKVVRQAMLANAAQS